MSMPVGGRLFKAANDVSGMPGLSLDASRGLTWAATCGELCTQRLRLRGVIGGGPGQAAVSSGFALGFK